MGPEWLFQHPRMAMTWWVTGGLWLIPEIVFSRRRRSRADARKADRGSKTVVIASAWIGVWLAFTATYALPQFAIGFVWKPAFYTGITLWLAGIAFRLHAMRVLGRFFTYDVAISRNQSVVDAGPYRWIRHPSYLGSLISVLGLGMTLRNLAAMFVPIAVLAIGYTYRIPIEECALREGLGDPYREYMKRTWRLVPYVF